MNSRNSGIGAGLIVLALMSGVAGCSVTRGQSSVGEYVDDSAITTSVKSKFVSDKQVDAASISVETLNGTVQLSGFAKSDAERSAAEQIARNTKGVKAVKNGIVVRS
jgi:osmotically-inducible protein OsmY